MQQPYRLMLIEDSRTQAERLVRLFEKEGWEVAHAGTAEAALEGLNTARPDLVVVDYHLPGMNGDEFCREIRMNVATRDIPVLMLTVEETHDAETRGLQSGADDYLAKTVDPDILVLRARSLLRQSHRPQETLGVAEHPFSRSRILAIDDSPTYLEYIGSELRAENYVVETAQSGLEGLARIQSERFDCVLVDVEMPGVDGLEVCRRLTEMRRATDGPTAIVMLTSHDEKELMSRALEAGADDFIAKASDIGVIKARIRASLRRKFFMEENRRILEELQDRELQAVRARAEKEAAEERAAMAGQLAESNRELEATNRKLRDALEVTRAITEHAAEALFMTDGTGRVTFMNPAAERMFGYTQEELTGRDLHAAVHGRRADGRPYPRSECALMNCFETGVPVSGVEDVFIRKDGAPVDVSCSNAPIVQDGRVTAGVIVAHDVTARKQAEERLRHTQKLESVGLLAGGIAHDFNNILTGIMGIASLIQQDAPPEMAEQLGVIVSGAERAAHLTRQLLAYAGKGRFVVEQMDLSGCVREMIALIRLSVPKTLVIHFDLQDQLPLVSADPGQMQQVLMNLVINAGEALVPGREGRVRIATGTEEVERPFLDAAGAEVQPGSYVRLEVSDNGAGMDEATMARIFDPFYTTKFTGRGLGLAAVAGIMRSQRGGIRIESTPEVGTTFRLLFPAMKGAAPARESARGAADGGTVLVIDDEAGVRGFIRNALERQGFSVLLAAGGREGLDLLERHGDAVRLVVLDLVMPEMSGGDVLVELRKRHPGMRVLLTTAHNDSQAQDLCEHYGGARLLLKPYNAQVLAENVKAALAGS